MSFKLAFQGHFTFRNCRGDVTKHFRQIDKPNTKRYEAIKCGVVSDSEDVLKNCKKQERTIEQRENDILELNLSPRIKEIFGGETEYLRNIDDSDIALLHRLQNYHTEFMNPENSRHATHAEAKAGLELKRAVLWEKPLQ